MVCEEADGSWGGSSGRKGTVWDGLEKWPGGRKVNSGARRSVKHSCRLLWKQAEARAGSCQSKTGNGFSLLSFLIFTDQGISKLDLRHPKERYSVLILQMRSLSLKEASPKVKKSHS